MYRNVFFPPGSHVFKKIDAGAFTFLANGIVVWIWDACVSHDGILDGNQGNSDGNQGNLECEHD